MKTEDSYNGERKIFSPHFGIQHNQGEKINVNE